MNCVHISCVIECYWILGQNVLYSMGLLHFHELLYYTRTWDGKIVTTVALSATFVLLTKIMSEACIEEIFDSALARSVTLT